MIPRRRVLSILPVEDSAARRQTHQSISFAYLLLTPFKNNQYDFLSFHSPLCPCDRRYVPRLDWGYDVINLPQLDISTPS